MWKVFLRPAMIFIPFGLGILIQSWLSPHWILESGLDLATLLIRLALMGMFFLVCLQIRLQSVKPQWPHLWILLLNLAMGLVPYGILHALGQEELALAAFFVGITPTANAAPVVMDFLHGRVGFVLTGFVITNLSIGLLMVPLLPLVTGQHSTAYILRVLVQMLILIGIPMTAAALTRFFRPDACEWPKKLKNLSFSLWSFTLFIIACRAAEYLENTPGISWRKTCGIMLVSLVLCALNFALGHVLAPKRFARESSQTLGQKNTTFTIYLAMAFGGPAGALVALGPTFYVLWHNSWNAVQMYLYDRRRWVRSRVTESKIR